MCYHVWKNLSVKVWKGDVEKLRKWWVDKQILLMKLNVENFVDNTVMLKLKWTWNVEKLNVEKLKTQKCLTKLNLIRCFNYILTLKSGIEFLKGRIKMLISWIYML